MHLISQNQSKKEKKEQNFNLRIGKLFFIRRRRRIRKKLRELFFD